MEFNSVNMSNSEQHYFLIAPSLSATDEQFLICAARSGDTDAFDELYKRHSRKILPLIYQITKNREDAEDALQDAALLAFANIRSFKGKASFRSWFTRIAINSAFTVLRRKRGAEISIEQVSSDMDYYRSFEIRDWAETPEERYARCEKKELLRNLIHRLPFAFREVVELRHSHDYSYAEIAEALGISVSSAKSRMARARKAVLRFCVSDAQ